MTRRIIIPFLCLCAAAVCLWDFGAPPSGGEEGDLSASMKLFTKAMDTSRRNFAGEVEPKDLIYGALKGMVGSLDDHSQFMDPEMFEEMQVDTEGKFGGLGIEITMRDKFLTIVSPLDDTPASRVGLASGDRIVKIEAEPTEQLTLMDAVKRLRGKPGTDVTITISRPGEDEYREYTLTRAEIKVKSIKESKIIEDGIGYINMVQFQERTGKDLESALKKLEKKGMKSLILDLRNNHGGLLHVAIEVADKFIPKGKLIVSTKGKSKKQDSEWTASNRQTRAEIPLVILVNRGSASGTEIVAGAVQDWHRGVIMGSKTFGKGTVQSVMRLEDGSALRLTTAEYFTPSGRSIHKEGITPDIVVEMSQEDELKLALKKYDELEKKLKKSEGGAEEGEEEEAAEVEVEDIPLRRAVDLLTSWDIYRKKTSPPADE